MDFESLKPFSVLDAHIHLPFPSLEKDLISALQTMHIKHVNLVSTPDMAEISHNPALIYFKSLHPKFATICGGLDHFSVQSNPSTMPQAFADQVTALKKAGFDGLKLLESKPIARKIIPIPLDSLVYEPMWSKLEELDLPVIWHVADPEEFWDADLCPQWVKDSGWFYGEDTYPLKETLYAEVESVLTRHPALKVILAHFYFLSADLPRAARFLEAHPNVCFDLTPGSEMFFNFNKTPVQTADFFDHFQDRLIFGTDSGASTVGKPGQPLNMAETLARTYVVRAFLESQDAVEIPDGVKHWRRLGVELTGLGLSDAILLKIYGENFRNLFGSDPAPLDLSYSHELLERQAYTLDALSGKPVASSACQVLDQLKP